MILGLNGAHPPGTHRLPMPMIDASNTEALSALAKMAGRADMGTIANDMVNIVNKQAEQAKLSAGPDMSMSPKH